MLTEMRRRTLLYSLVYCMAIACTRGSDVKPVVALDIGHTINHPGAYSARGVGEYYFNRKIVKALHESLKNSGKVDALIINPEGKPISLRERTRRAARGNAVLFLAVHHDSVQSRYLKEWEVNGKTQLHSDKFKGFSIFSLEEIRNSRKAGNLHVCSARRWLPGDSLQLCITPSGFQARAETC